ncbi:MAG: DUF433 domain-containing protein [Cyanothece sp. SIO2G6]|nr:DUF433 domain-containing protein [Cyanothece sp. SIO2G6]
MQALVDIGGLITSGQQRESGRPVVAGTNTSVHCIAALYKQGYSADDIVEDKDYLTLAQVYAALAYYFANQEAIETDLAEDIAEYGRLARQQVEVP